jgi:hypothetical protein
VGPLHGLITTAAVVVVSFAGIFLAGLGVTLYWLKSGEEQGE